MDVDCQQREGCTVARNGNHLRTVTNPDPCCLCQYLLPELAPYQRLCHVFGRFAVMISVGELVIMTALHSAQ